ncbi:MAG: hypothetical protein IJ728_00460 [Selenomonadaceae bacterium]|nr:hypothetical protein [Selenomonadaceae bacterium]
MINVDLNDSVAVLRAGHKALVDSLGRAGYLKFMELVTVGDGDYTEEKYQEPPLTMEEILEGLKNLKEN